MDRSRRSPVPQDDARKPDNRRHDQTYKGIFGHDEAVRSLIRDFLAVEWHHILDLAAITFIRTEVIARHLRRQLSDLAVQVRFKDREDSVVFLVEFQSSHDPRMVLRTSDYVLAMIEALRDGPNMLDPGGAVPRVLPYVLYTGAKPWTAATSLAALTGTPEPPPAAARALACLGIRRYAVLDLQLASAQDLLPEDSVLGWLGGRADAGGGRAGRREADCQGADHPTRGGSGDGSDVSGVGRRTPAQGDGAGSWGAGAVMVLRQASRKFGVETAKRLEELVGSMGPEQLVLLADAVVDCDTGDALLAEATACVSGAA